MYYLENRKTEQNIAGDEPKFSNMTKKKTTKKASLRQKKREMAKLPLIFKCCSPVEDLCHSYWATLLF